MAIFREIDSNTKINGALTVTDSSNFLNKVSVSDLLSAGDISDVNAAIKSKLNSSGGTISGDMTVNGTLFASNIEGIDLSNFYTKTELTTVGQSSVHWENVTNKSNIAILGEANVFYSNETAIKIKPTINLSTVRNNETVIFNTVTKVLAFKPIDSLSEVIVNGITTYEREIDYNINYFTGEIKRLINGSIPEGQSVKVSYESTKPVFEIVNPTDTEKYLSIDNKGNIYGKSISVILTSSSQSSESDTEGNFNVEGNLTVRGNSKLGDKGDDHTIITGTMNIHNASQSSVLSVDMNGNLDMSGSLSIGGSRKDLNWDLAYAHISKADIHTTLADKQKYGEAYTHSGIAHAPSDAPSKSVFDSHKNNVTVHITSPERTRWDLANDHISTNHIKLGVESTSAYFGNLGKVAYDHSQVAHAPVDAQKNSSITIAEIENKLIGTISTHIHNYIPTIDNRALIEKPELLSIGLTSDFKTNAGNSVPGANNSLINIRPFSDLSVSHAYQMSFSSDGNIYKRRSTSKDTWSPWHKLWDSNSFDPERYLPLTGEKVITGNLTIGTAADKKLLKMNGSVAMDNMTIASSSRIDRLNSDTVDGFHAKDIFNATVLSVGSGVLEGCKLEGLNNSFGLKLSKGTVFIKDHGVVAVEAVNSFNGVKLNEYNLVFINGENTTDSKFKIGEIGVVSSPELWPTKDMIIPLNSVIIAKVYPTNVSFISNDHITTCREYINIQSSKSSVTLLKSDKENASLASNPAEVDRVLFSRVGDRTKMVVSDIPTINNVKKSIIIESDRMSFEVDSSNTFVNSERINLWNDSNNKKHEHYYDAPLTGPSNAGKVYALNSQHNVPQGARVFRNGLRQKLGVDYNISGHSIEFVRGSLAEDTVMIDYDL